jgi:transposase-like protein
VTFFEFNSKFPTEKAAIDYFFKARYHDTLICSHCGTNVKVYKDRKRGRVRRRHNCDNTFSLFTDTIFEKTTADMRKCSYAVHLVLNGYKGVSSYQLQREIGVTCKTAWRILRLIREAVGIEDTAKAVECFV